jgi:ElaB/YqjD/DUF883 family membrane-anchored ribosome-binding protein
LDEPVLRATVPAGTAFADARVLTAEVRALQAEVAELTKSKEYAWSDGFNSASAGLAENESQEYRDEIAKLREDYDKLLTSWAESGALLKNARATIARIEALVDGYEAFVDSCTVDSNIHVVSTYQQVITEIRAALKGEL